MKCPKCGTETNSKFCPNCGISLETINIPQQSQSELTDGKVVVDKALKKKNTVLGILAFILSITIVLFPIGAILAIADLIKDKEKKHKHGLSVIAIVISVFLLFLLINSSDGGEQTEKATQTKHTESGAGSSAKDSVMQTNEKMSTAPTESTASAASTVSEETKTEYEPISCQTLMADLKRNALDATDKYKNKYMAVSGKLQTIDAQGKYIEIVDASDEYAILGVRCKISSDETRQIVKTLSVGSVITVKGKITDVGEVFGYYMTTDSIDVGNATSSVGQSEKIWMWDGKYLGEGYDNASYEMQLSIPFTSGISPVLDDVVGYVYSYFEESYLTHKDLYYGGESAEYPGGQEFYYYIDSEYHRLTCYKSFDERRHLLCYDSDQTTILADLEYSFY